MRNAFVASRAPWKIAYMHHPIFNAGPRHREENNEVRFRHFVDLFEKSGVRVVFHGHEHNFQMSAANQRSRGIRFVVTGAGGELRKGDIRARMAESNIEGWAPQHHFLLVEIEGNLMRVTPLGYAPVVVRDKDAATVPIPITVGNVR
jgi:hypothetical protein